MRVLYFIKAISKRIIYGHKATNKTYFNYLRKAGAKIGEGTECFGVRDVYIDETRPWLINIGDNVILTKGVTILTHGYDLSVLMNYYGELYGSSGKVTIGNNVFVGMHSTILKGVTVGNNVIIGANSLVNKDIPDNCVYAGNPAKFIMTIENYRNKRKNEYLMDLKELVFEYYNRYGEKPNDKILREFFPVYLNRTDLHLADKLFIGNSKVVENFITTSPIYDGLDELYKECGI